MSNKLNGRCPRCGALDGALHDPECPTQQIPYDVIRAGRPAVMQFQECIMNGETPKLAEMLALRSAPAVTSATDRLFKFNRGDDDLEKHPELYKAYASRLLAMGGSTAGKKYFPSLAEDVGDPRAWISTDANGESEIRQLCAERGYSIRGAVNQSSGTRVEHDNDYGLADDIVDDEVHDLMAADPDKGRTFKARQELREQVRQKHGPHYARTAKKRTKKPKLISVG